MSGRPNPKRDVDFLSEDDDDVSKSVSDDGDKDDIVSREGRSGDV